VQLPPPPQLTVEPTYYYSNLDQIEGSDGVWDLSYRLPEVLKYTEFRPGDEVIDIGCAEGLITMEVAKRVKHIRGVELSPQRVDAAKQIAAERGIENVSFEAGSVTTLELPARSYDLVLFLGVFQHLKRDDKWLSMVKVFGAAKRSVILRMPLFHAQNPYRTTKLAELCRELDFTLTIYPRQETSGGSFMIASRLSPE
jgi:2-polyprenyl-3-methyl-5-hydroxy-6-metoxy-1,4-benzoquinol methylase